MTRIPQILFFIITLLLSGCVAKFIPVVDVGTELLVVQGLITDQNETDTIKLSKSLPLGQKSEARPVSGCDVKISDDLGNIFSLREYKSGTYITDRANFRGVSGRSYTLKISANTGNTKLNYESLPVEMISVPPIDSIYYEKKSVEPATENFPGVDACQIYLDTNDPANKCQFYRWDFTETWKLRLLYSVPNQTCWITDRSHSINIKSTAALGEAIISRYPMNYISNVTDRLKTKYSILVNQYSLNEDEFNYWQKIQSIDEQAGGLYDIIPASIPGNIRCIENPEEKVLGYFSVSAKSSKRIYINDAFAGIINQYTGCITDTVYSDNFPDLNISKWILFAHKCTIPCVPFYEITTRRECADCTTRGTNLKPDFWIDD